MLRYVAIGAVVGFVIAYFLLSSHDAPVAPAEPPAPAPVQIVKRPPPAVIIGERLPVMPLQMQRAITERDGGLP